MTTWSDERIATLRAETPGCARRIHFNNAGAGLMPQPVVAAIKEHIDLEAEIGGYEAGDAQVEAIDASYRSVADLLNTSPQNIAFVENATVAYAQALSSIPFEQGDVLLTTTNDYVSNQLMFLSLVKRFGIEIVRAPDTESGEVDLEGLRSEVQGRRPKLVAITHVPTNSGLVQPVEAIGAVCRELETLYLVDACQSVGQRVIDVEAIGCDFLSATSRKFLRGPRGAGFLYVADSLLDEGFEPLFIDMQGGLWTDRDTYELVPTARRFENWEFAYALVLGTGAAAEYAVAIGISEIASRTAGLAARLRSAVGDTGLRLLDRGAERCGIVTVEIPGWDPKAFHGELERRGVNAAVSTRGYAVIDYDAKGVEWAIRLSPHYYNTEAEVDEVAGVLGELARTGG
jgi:selenocysteine lyase/cysteine desulfurase